jgi:hypothetical protein
MEQAKNHLDRCTLARTIWTKQAKDLVAPNFKINVINRTSLRSHPEIGKRLRQPSSLDDNALVGI